MGTRNRDPRVQWALERTLLAWVRTNTALMGFGFVVARSEHLLGLLSAGAREGRPSGWPLGLGLALVLLGTALQAASLGGYLLSSRGSRPSMTGVVTACSLVLLGLLMFLHLAGRL